METEVVLSGSGILEVPWVGSRSIDYNESMAEISSLIKTLYFI
jgi:hypothetical protein